jgi:hypothetical protein
VPVNPNGLTFGFAERAFVDEIVDSEQRPQQRNGRSGTDPKNAPVAAPSAVRPYASVRRSNAWLSFIRHLQRQPRDLTNHRGQPSEDPADQRRC